MKCTNCGNEIPDTANVCGHCGHRLKGSAPVQSSLPEVQQTQKSSSGIPGWVWGFGGFVLIGGLILVVGIVLMSSSGLFVPTSNNQSNQPVEPVAPIQVVITATAPLPPQPSPTTGPQWVTVLEEDFTDGSGWNLDVPHEIINGKLILNGNASTQDIATLVDTDYQFSFDFQPPPQSGNCGEKASIAIGIVSGNSNSDLQFRDNVLYVQLKYIEEILTFELEEIKISGIIEPNETNHIEFRSIGSMISIRINQSDVGNFTKPNDGSYHALELRYFDNIRPSDNCSRQKIEIDNVKLEEYRVP